MSLSTSDAELQKLAEKVTHIVRREKILVNSQDAKAVWVKKFTDLVPYVSAKRNSKTRKIEVRAEARPNAREIKEIIEKNAKEERKSDDWNNVGFETENGTTWVDRYRLRETIKIEKSNDTILSAVELFKEISKQRDRFLRPIRRSTSMASPVVADTASS